MDVMEKFQQQYPTEERELTIRGRSFRFFVPAELETFIDPDDLFHEFPLWSKVWEASLVLADHLAAMTPEPEKRLIEIGAGIGVVGVVAAAFGHRMTITEMNPQALDFIRANSLVNQCATAEIFQMDWNEPEVTGRFDYLVGSEVVYHERDFDPLKKLFQRLLKPGAKVLLCSEVRKTALGFYQQLQPTYKILAQKKRIRSEDQEIPVLLCQIESNL